MNGNIRFKLFLMMVLEFAIWGAWFPLVFNYLPHLEFSGWQQAVILNAFPVSTVIGMFFANQFADRHFAAERVLAFSHLAGGLAILSLGFVTSFLPFAILMWVHCLLYVPTISITNSIAFHAMKDAQSEFGLIRMGGTVGWILVAWPLFFLLSSDPASARYTFVVAGAASLCLAAFSLGLPHTPPKPDSSGGGMAMLKAVSCLATPFILVLWIVTLIDATVHQSYFVWTAGFLEEQVKIPKAWIMPIMSIGQVAEIATMAVLGIVLKRLGWKTTMIIGVLGHAARFATYAYASQFPAAIILVQVLHGICYAFFFATVYIFIDEFLPKDIRVSAQGLFNLMILGLGMFLGTTIGTELKASLTTKVAGVTKVDYQTLFLYPCGASLVAAAFLLIFFWPPKRRTDG